MLLLSAFVDAYHTETSVALAPLVSHVLWPLMV